jgi:hypothetical protein
MTQGIPGAVAATVLGKPMVVFSLANGGHLYHIRAVFTYRKTTYPQKAAGITSHAVCSFEPANSGKMRRAPWYFTRASRPDLAEVCGKCLRKTQMGAGVEPQDSTVIWGDAVFALVAAHGLHITP